MFLDYQSGYWPNYSCETAWLRLSVTSSGLWRIKRSQLSWQLTLAQPLILWITVSWLQYSERGLALLILHYHGSSHTSTQDTEKWMLALIYSKDGELVCCVPQGSCAGPILFTVYTSTIESVITTQTSDNGEEE